MKMGKLIGTMRGIKGLTLRQLSQQTGISNATLSQIETGYNKRPSFHYVVRIARALKISLNTLADCE